MRISDWLPYRREERVSLEEIDARLELAKEVHRRVREQVDRAADEATSEVIRELARMRRLLRQRDTRH